ncbi:Cell division protein FtsQ OS=Streptomyces glaucescens OX=1907 GN=ftsQ PE=3 SV=1 [Streptomyces glaucescens]
MKPSRSRSASASLRRFGEPRLVREAVRVAGALPAAVARRTRTVEVRSFDDITLKLAGGRTVAWGSGEKGAAKARTLTALMKAAPDARHFDVSVPTAPASSGS